MAYYTDLLLIIIVLVILLVKLSKDTLAALLPVFLCIFVIPVLVGAAAITIMYAGWNRKNRADKL